MDDGLLTVLANTTVEVYTPIAHFLFLLTFLRIRSVGLISNKF